MRVKTCKRGVKIGSVVCFSGFSDDLLRWVAAGCMAIAQAFLAA
jgi:hypothetical protein